MGRISETAEAFHLPRYEDIPNVGLYLEQTVNYITDYLKPLEDLQVTGSMISNYVKKKLVANPVRKQYNRDQIASLIFIVITKSVLSLDNISVLLGIREKRYDTAAAYNYFCDNMEGTIREVFEISSDTDTLPGIVMETPADAAVLSAQHLQERKILQNTIIAVANKIYLDQWIRCYAQSEGSE